MEIINNIADLQQAITTIKNQGKKVGFVPTMGALHLGHMELLQQAKTACDFVVVSVFVNPTQFNNQEDLTLYPRTPESDSQLLHENGCDIAFFPTVDEIYPTNYISPQVELGSLATVMEGQFRPGHFEGVVQVVSRLFELVQPHTAFFGMKDFQQVAIIKHMVKELQLPVEIVTCPTARNKDGLALSSRNKRLSEEQLQDALHIYRTLQKAKEWSSTHTPSEVKALASAFFNEGKLEVEYITIVDPQSLQELNDIWVVGATMCVACYCGNVRLIDNFTLIPF